MSRAARIYVVRDVTTVGRVRLVRAANPVQALRHVARNTLTCELATQEDLVHLTLKGVLAEDIIDPLPDLIGPRSVNAA